MFKQKLETENNLNKVFLFCLSFAVDRGICSETHLSSTFFYSLDTRLVLILNFLIN